MNDSLLDCDSATVLVLELVDGIGCSCSLSSLVSSSFALEDCSQFTNHDGCGSNPVTDSVTRLNID